MTPFPGTSRQKVIMTVQLEQRPFTVAEYYRMADAGILKEEDRIELIEGKIVTMSPIGSRHAACVIRLTTLLNRQLDQTALVSVQNPIILDDYSEPQADIALLRPREDFYARELPQPADVLLLIEVSDTSKEYDRTVKIPLYARSGIAEVWLVILAENIIEMYAQPAGDTYREMSQAGPGAIAVAHSIADLAIPVDSILG